jgi:hypothetical protein
MYSNSRWFVLGMAGATAFVVADAVYAAGRSEGKASAFVDSEPSPDEADAAEPEDSPSPTESDEG